MQRLFSDPIHTTPRGAAPRGVVSIGFLTAGYEFVSLVLISERNRNRLLRIFPVRGSPDRHIDRGPCLIIL